MLITQNKSLSYRRIYNNASTRFNQGCGYRSKLERWLKDEGLLPKRIMEFNILETILNSVALGLGITLVPQSAVHHLSKAGKVHCHAIPEKYGSISTVFIRRKDSYMTNSMRSF